MKKVNQKVKAKAIVIIKNIEKEINQIIIIIIIILIILGIKMLILIIIHHIIKIKINIFLIHILLRLYMD